VRLNSLGTPATSGSILGVPEEDDDDFDQYAVDGMRIGKGNRNTR
jgi:hypothetical protein